jgi:hypothetical protein
MLTPSLCGSSVEMASAIVEVPAYVDLRYDWIMPVKNGGALA